MAVILQQRTPRTTAVLIALTLAMSLTAAVDARLGGLLYYHLALLPEAIWCGQLWRLVTWPFVQGRPLSLIFTCVAIYVFGTDLLLNWGPRRYLRYLAAVVLIASVGTSLIALLWEPAWGHPHLG